MKPERRGFIFAKVGVGLAGHHRFLRIPAGAKRGHALGVWTAATNFTRKEQLDGFCPLEALQTVSTEDIVNRLVEVGLFAREDQDGVHGVRVLKYEEFNDTKADIEAARHRERSKKHKQRQDDRPLGSPHGVPRGQEKMSPGESPGTPQKAPVSVSSSVSLSPSGSPELNPPPPQPSQDRKPDPGSGVVRRAGVLKVEELEREPETEAKRLQALRDLESLGERWAAEGGK